MSARTKALAAAGAGALVVALVLTAWVSTPRTSGLEGDWAAKAFDGELVAGRALVRGSTALDLRTGRTVTLGSVPGGTPSVGDDRLVIASPGRVDSVRLDASARWTWRAPAGATSVPLAAADDHTLLLVCPTDGSCSHVGLGPQGRESWRSPATRPTGVRQPTGLPTVLGEVLTDGVRLTDPRTGRQTLQPGARVVAVADGPVVVAGDQGGRCVVTSHRAADPAWTTVLGPCPDGVLPGLTVEDDRVVATWPRHVERLDLATGAVVAARPVPPRAGEVARAGDVVAVRTQRRLHTDPLRWGDEVTLLSVRDVRTGDDLGQVVSGDRLQLVSLERRALVVREGDRVVRYTLAG